MLGSRTWVAQNAGSIGSRAFVVRLLRTGRVIGLIASAACLLCITADAADLPHCQQQLIVGNYRECIEEARKAIGDRAWGESWHVVKARAELAIGRDADACATVDAVLKRYSWSIGLRLVGHRAYQQIGQTERAQQLLKEIDALARRMPWRYTDADDLVTLARIIHNNGNL